VATEQDEVGSGVPSELHQLVSRAAFTDLLFHEFCIDPFADQLVHHVAQVGVQRLDAVHEERFPGATVVIFSICVMISFAPLPAASSFARGSTRSVVGDLSVAHMILVNMTAPFHPRVTFRSVGETAARPQRFPGSQVRCRG